MFLFLFPRSYHQRDEESPAEDSGGERERKEDLCQNVCINISHPCNILFEVPDSNLKSRSTADGESGVGGEKKLSSLFCFSCSHLAPSLTVRTVTREKK